MEYPVRLWIYDTIGEFNVHWLDKDRFGIFFCFANQFWLIANQFEILEQKC